MVLRTMRSSGLLIAPLNLTYDSMSANLVDADMESLRTEIRFGKYERVQSLYISMFLVTSDSLYDIREASEQCLKPTRSVASCHCAVGSIASPDSRLFNLYLSEGIRCAGPCAP